MRTLLLLVATVSFAADPERIKIVLTGDSTVAEQGGWGPGLRAVFGSPVDVVNLAQNGRSSRSYREEGWWAKAIAEKPQYIVIQFGHNDCPGKGPDRETDPSTTYRQNLTRYVAEAREAGANPVLATSIVRRNFDADGHIVSDCLVPFVHEVRKLAGELQVPLMDLYAVTKLQAEERGPLASDELGPTVEGKPDRTHLNVLGQQEIGRIATRELVRVIPELAGHAR